MYVCVASGKKIKRNSLYLFTSATTAPPPPTPPYVEEYHIKYYGKHTSHSADMTRTKPAEYRDRLTDKDMSGVDWIGFWKDTSYCHLIGYWINIFNIKKKVDGFSRILLCF